MTRLKAAALGTALAMLIAAGAEAGGGSRVDSKVSLNLGPKPGQFTGVVRADDPLCVAGRKVKIIRKLPAPKTRVAKDFTDIQGLYSVRTGERSGVWYAKVKRERRGGLLCKGDRSRTRAAG